MKIWTEIRRKSDGRMGRIIGSDFLNKTFEVRWDDDNEPREEEVGASEIEEAT